MSFNLPDDLTINHPNFNDYDGEECTECNGTGEMDVLELEETIVVQCNHCEGTGLEPYEEPDEPEWEPDFD